MSMLSHMFRRSNRNATEPKPMYEPPEQPCRGHNGCLKPIETSIETQSVIGLFHQSGHVDDAAQGPDGELVASRDNRQSILAGCGHIAQLQDSVTDQNQYPRIAGVCAYCLAENAELVEREEISPLEAERLSLICSDCGKVTTSGLLCCPRHYTVIERPAGKIIYLDPQEAKQLKRKETLARGQEILMLLFGQDGSGRDIAQKEERTDAK